MWKNKKAQQTAVKRESAKEGCGEGCRKNCRYFSSETQGKSWKIAGRKQNRATKKYKTKTKIGKVKQKTQ